MPGVNTAGNQDTTGTAATASFVTGSAVKGNISGNAATATLAADATTLATARGILTAQPQLYHTNIKVR